MIFDNDFQIDIKAILALFLGGSLVACTGGDGSSSTVTVPPVATASAPVAYTSHFNKVVSAPFTSASLAWEAITVADINGDGYKDLVLSNGPAGRALSVVLPTDPRPTIAINNGSNSLTQIDTSNLAPTGWVNDWLVVPTTDGNPYIVGIDSGREVARDPKYWSKMELYRYENGKIAEYTDAAPTNLARFYHNASSYGDLNNDGMMDFVVARMDNGSPFSVYYGDKKEVFIEAKVDTRYSTWEGQDYVGQTGAALVIDIGADNKQDFILLPYNNIWSGKNEGIYAEVFNSDLQQTAKIDVRTSLNIPKEWGFSYAQVVDINRDGLQDFVAMLENPIDGFTTGVRGFVTFIQNKDGKFDFFASTPTLLVDSKQQFFRDGVWSEYKFQLVDVDGDKNLDLFWGSQFGGKPSDLPNSVFYGDGAGHFSRNESKTTELFRDVKWVGEARTHMADFNNDGLGDLLVLDRQYNVVTPTIYINNGVVL